MSTHCRFAPLIIEQPKVTMFKKICSVATAAREFLVGVVRFLLAMITNTFEAAKAVVVRAFGRLQSYFGKDTSTVIVLFLLLSLLIGPIAVIRAILIGAMLFYVQIWFTRTVFNR